MAKVTGNKGEWSELYVLLELLASGKLYAANESLEKLEDIYFPILKILREEEPDKLTEYVISDEQRVELYINGQKHKDIPQDVLREYADCIYSGIRSGSDRAFEIAESEEILSDIECEKIKAPSTDKTDIKMQLLDINTGYKSICGFSIKSELGNAPTLLNAGKTTNFQFEIVACNDERLRAINSIETRNKIIDRVQFIDDFGTLKFVKALNDGFNNNLLFIDTYMDEIIGQSLLYSYRTGAATCKDVVEHLELTNPLGFPKKGIYEYKFKKFLCAIALGMTPSKDWDGRDEANGGYIVVKSDGEVLAYHIYNRDYFEEYLLNNTKLERASTTRHEYAKAYKEDGKYYFDMNLQIRFIQ